MTYIFIWFLLELSSNTLYQKKEFYYEKIELESSLNELSGLEFFNQKIISHNDSGSDSSIYISNLENPLFEKKVIPGVINTDWEDICFDNEHLFIADIGNNYQTRKNLKIYKLNRSFSVVDSIDFRYHDQIDFEKRYKNLYDAEAIISFRNDLILFSKNRLNYKSFIYVLPKNGKNLSIKPIKEIRFKGLVTGADYNSNLNLLVLIGYSGDQKSQYLYLIPDFSIDSENYNIITKELPFEKTQMEGIKIISNELILVSSEDESSNSPFLLKIHIPNGLRNNKGEFNIKGLEK